MTGEGSSITTRWWWIRHAPVDSGGRIYGQSDLSAACDDPGAFAWLAEHVPQEAVWIASNLKRTQQTAAAIFRHWQHAPELLVEPRFAEQHFGEWQGLTHGELAARAERRWHRFWLAPAAMAPPGGESFVELTARAQAAIAEHGEHHKGRDLVVVAHGGTIRAAVGLALGLDPERALALSVDNCSLTRIDQIEDAQGTEGDRCHWRLAQLNLLPLPRG